MKDSGNQTQPAAGNAETAVVKFDGRKPWTICPECRCGRGEDHKRGCSRSKRPARAALSKAEPTT